MHPTADTRDVIKLNRSWRRVIGSVRLLGYFKSMMETRGCKPRAALARSVAPMWGRGRASGYPGGASREVRGSE
jgi:hypothetical protein